MSLFSRSVAGSIITSVAFTSLVFAQSATSQGHEMMRTAGEHIKKADLTAARAVNGECMATAVGAREDGLTAAHNTRNAAITAAFGVRKTELQAAWKMTDAAARRTAREAAWKKFRAAAQAANKGGKVSMQDLHVSFNVAAKKCGVDYKESPENVSSAM